jgi:hypothetical protein
MDKNKLIFNRKCSEEYRGLKIHVCVCVCVCVCGCVSVPFVAVYGFEKK